MKKEKKKPSIAREQALADLKSKFFKTTPKSLHYKAEDECIFSKRFVEKLKRTIGNPAEFLKMNAAQREEHAQKIQDLLLVETDWKSTVSKSKYEEKIMKKMFPHELRAFKKAYKEYFFPPEGVTHSKTLGKYGSTQALVFCLNLVNYLEHQKVIFLKNFPFEEIKEGGASHDKFKKRLKEAINDTEESFFFIDIMKICMKKAYDNRINVEHTSVQAYNIEPLSDPFLYVPRTVIMYSVQRSIILYLSVLTVNCLNDSVKSVKLPQDNALLVNYFNTFFTTQNEELLSMKKKNQPKHDWYRDTFSIAMILIEIFCECGIVIKRENVRSRNKTDKTNVILWLQHKLSNTVPFSHHLPRIIPPRKIDTENNIEKFLTPYYKGNLSISPSKVFKMSLNLAQKKTFKVSSDYLYILNLLHNSLDEVDVKTPFPKKTEVAEQSHNYRVWDSSISISSLQRYINNKAQVFLGVSKYAKKRHSFLDTLGVAEVTQVELGLNYKKKTAFTEYQVAVSSRQLLQTSILIAEIYKDFPLYYGTKLDFRTRMYPWEYLLSRITGELKQLLCDYKNVKLTVKGMEHLLTAYYRFSLEGSVKWNKHLLDKSYSTNKDKIAGMRAHFKAFNYDSHTTAFEGGVKHICYLLLLHTKLKTVFAEVPNYEVDILVEIDQVVSGITLLAILLRNRRLAEECNLLGGEPRDLYQYIMSHTESFFKKATYVNKKKEEKPFDTGRVLSFLQKSRNVVKDVVMKWGYSEGFHNRALTITAAFKDYYNSTATDEEYSTMFAFARQYDDFLNTIFPGLDAQKKRLQSVLDTRVTSGGNFLGMNIRTVDGCGVGWDVSPMEEMTKGYWNPSIKKSVTVKISVPHKSGNALKRMRSKYETGLFPNLCHSVDGGVMRLIIYRVWLRTGYIIGHLHDCILCHPNYIDDVYHVIEEIYTDDTLVDLVDKVFFTPMQEGLSDDSKKFIREVKDEFYKSGDEFSIVKGQFVPKNAYVWEGSVKNRDLYIELKKRGMEKIV